MCVCLCVYVSLCLSQAEENRQKENEAAIRIQSWFRACKVRAYLRYKCLCVWWVYAEFIKGKKKQTFGAPSYAIVKEELSLNILYTNLKVCFFLQGLKNLQAGLLELISREILILAHSHNYPTSRALQMA